MLIDIPIKYIKQTHIGIKPMLAAANKAEDKRRLKDAISDVELVWQIDGFDIPNYTSEEYYCQAIMCLNIELNNIKSAEFVGNILQKAIKELCIINFYDKKNSALCFALKRLNKLDKTEIILEDFYLQTIPPLLKATAKDGGVQAVTGCGNRCWDVSEADRGIFFKSILNQTNKQVFYIELLVRTFLALNPKLYKKQDEILNSKIWYKPQLVLDLYQNLTLLKKMKLKASKTVEIAERSRLNGQIKELIKTLENLSMS